MAQHQFAPGGKVRFHWKDLGIALQLAREHGASLPLAALVDQLFGALVANGSGDLDHSALLTITELLSNYSVADRAPLHQANGHSQVTDRADPAGTGPDSANRPAI